MIDFNKIHFLHRWHHTKIIRFSNEMLKRRICVIAADFISENDKLVLKHNIIPDSHSEKNGIRTDTELFIFTREEINEFINQVRLRSRFAGSEVNLTIDDIERKNLYDV